MQTLRKCICWYFQNEISSPHKWSLMIVIRFKLISVQFQEFKNCETILTSFANATKLVTQLSIDSLVS